MAKDSERLEKEFIATAKEKTGYSVAEWMPIIEASGENKTNAMVKWLKETHHLNHMQATFLTLIFQNDGQPVYDYPVLFQKLFADKPTLLPIYQHLESELKASIPDLYIIPTKTYVSLEGKKIFGCVTPTKKNLRLGLDLGDLPFDDYVQKAKSLGAMPNITHMIELDSTAHVTPDLLTWVKRSYQRVNP